MVPWDVAVANVVRVQQGELSREIAELHEDVRSTKLAQDAQVKAIKDGVKDDTTAEVLRLARYVIRCDP